MLKLGDIVFFRKFSRSAQPRSAQIEFKNITQGFAMFLGQVPAFAPDPPGPVLLQILGKIGLVSLDDIREFLGQEAMEEVAQKFSKKYYGENFMKLLKQSEKPPAPKLVSTNGKPIEVL